MVRHTSFLVYPLDLLHKFTCTYLDFGFFGNLIHLYSLYIKFLFVGSRFCFIASSSPNLTVDTLQTPYSLASAGLPQWTYTTRYMSCMAHQKFSDYSLFFCSFNISFSVYGFPFIKRTQASIILIPFFLHVSI